MDTMLYESAMCEYNMALNLPLVILPDGFHAQVYPQAWNFAFKKNFCIGVLETNP